MPANTQELQSIIRDMTTFANGMKNMRIADVENEFRDLISRLVRVQNDFRDDRTITSAARRAEQSLTLAFNFFRSQWESARDSVKKAYQQTLREW